MAKPTTRRPTSGPANPGSVPPRGEAYPAPRRPAGSPWWPSLLLLAILAAFCALTAWGRTYPTFASRSWKAWVTTHAVPREKRLLALYDDTYPVLLYLREFLPPDAKVLLPPLAFIRIGRGDEIPLLASPSSAYSFIYPRVPVHFGEPSPFRSEITHILVVNHWGLEYVAPGEPPTEQNRVGLFPWPAGQEVSW